MEKVKLKRGHEIRACRHCGVTIKVPFSDARNGLGKYCSYECANKGRSHTSEILALLPATIYEVAEKMGVKPNDSVKTMARLVDKGLAHPSGMKQVLRETGKSYQTLIYSAGDSPDPAVPVLSLKATLSYFIEKSVLDAMPGTYMDIIEKTKMSMTTVKKIVYMLRKSVREDGTKERCFIRSWRRPKQGKYLPVYQAGPGKDVACKFKPKTRQERNLVYIAKLRRLGKLDEHRELDYSRRRAKRAERSTIRQGDPLLNALFGAPSQRKQKQENV